jgi:hypothetical protein
MRVHEFSQDYESRNFRLLKIAPSAIYLLSQHNTPARVRDEIIERAETGETIDVKTVKAALKDKQPAQEESEEQPAQEESRPAWLGRRLIVANKAAGAARIEDWNQFEVNRGLMHAVEETADAWRCLVEHLKSRRTSEQQSEGAVEHLEGAA